LLDSERRAARGPGAAGWGGGGERDRYKFICYDDRERFVVIPFENIIPTNGNGLGIPTDKSTRKTPFTIIYTHIHILFCTAAYMYMLRIHILLL